MNIPGDKSHAALSLVLIPRIACRTRRLAVFYFARKEAAFMPMRKLKNYKPTRFMAESSHYSKQMADFAVMFIEQLCHT